MTDRAGSGPPGGALVVGAGMSGISCASALADAGQPVRIVDRGRVLGGRMASRRLRDTGTQWDGRIVDYGASYFTARHPDFVALVRSLVEEGVVREWTDAFHVADPEGLLGLRVGPMRYAAPGGLRSIVEHLARQRDLSVESQHVVESVRPVQSGSGLELDIDGERVLGAALCMPGPQAQRIVEPSLVPSEIGELTWEPVIAVTMVFPDRSWPKLDGAFVNDSPVLTWLADDGRRRGDGAPVLVAHVNPVLAAHHLDDPQAVAPAAIAATRRILGITDLPSWAWAHRWSLARPLTAVEADFATAPMGRLAYAGDAFASGPRVEAAWLSGRSAGNWLATSLAR